MQFPTRRNSLNVGERGVPRRSTGRRNRNARNSPDKRTALYPLR